MATILFIIGTLLIIICATIIGIAIAIFQYTTWFTDHKCSKCGHLLEYTETKGNKPNEYLFKCPKCGNTEYLTMEEIQSKIPQ